MTKHNRDEQVWRNELAFARKRLEQEGYIDGTFWDNWQLTDSGKMFLRLLCWYAIRAIRFKELTEAARIRPSDFR